MRQWDITGILLSKNRAKILIKSGGHFCVVTDNLPTNLEGTHVCSGFGFVSNIGKEGFLISTSGYFSFKISFCHPDGFFTILFY